MAEQRQQRIPHGVQTGAVTAARDMQGPVGRKLMILQRTPVKTSKRKRRRTKCWGNVSLEKWRARKKPWRTQSEEARSW